MTKILFLDESGDHNLKKIDPEHPIFVLGGVIVDEEYAFGEMSNKVREFKQEIFGTTDLTLHTADFTRQRNGFERMKDKDFCQNFYEKFNQLILGLKVKIVACAIKKKLHINQYGLDAIDPYHLSLNLLVEKFYFDLDKSAVRGKIIAETRSRRLDRQLELSWLNLKNSGTKFIKASKINSNIENLILEKKSSNLAGLEIADAVVTPIAREILKRKSRIDQRIIKDKMTSIRGDSLVILPKK